MADSKITALAALTAADPVNDMFPVVDVSDTSMAASGTTKRISANNILSSSPTASGALTVTGLVTAGSATITGDLTVDTNVLKVDTTNNRVGIGTATPAYLVDVLAAGATTVNDSFNVARFTGASAVANDFSLVGPATSQVRLNFSHPTASGNGEVGYDHATNNLRFVTNGTQKGAFNSTGAFVLAGGDITSNGTGVNFPATQAASSNANTLDDYEEGTWTPNIGGTATYTLQNGRYVKIGNRVYVTLRLAILLRGTGSTSVISGIPFAVGASSPICSASIGYFVDLAISINYISAYANSSSITLTGTTTAASSATNNLAVIGNGTDISMSFFYEV